MLSKKFIYYFLLSFSATFIIGFFVWSAFVDFPGNFVQPVLAEISSKFFTASIQIDESLKKNDIKPAPKEVNLLSPTEFENKNIVVDAGQDSQDFLDDINEELDVIDQQINLEQDEQNQIVFADENDVSEDQSDNKDDDENIDDKNKNEKNIIIYPKILISEVQSAGVGDDKQEFVELYNASTKEVDLTGWYLQRKTANASDWSSYVSSNLFSGKKIPANGYFLVARNGYYYNLADIFTENPITNDNSFVLKNPNGEIADQASFGEIISGQTFCRLNLADAVCSPTPKLQNVAYVAPLVGGGGGPAQITYPKILISEVQVAGQADDKQEFVELYNPNNQDVDLTNWYLQRKTATSSSWSTYVPNNLFSGKIITADGYFLIARIGYYTDLADISTDYAITNDNSFALKNPDGDISDKLGFGSALDFELSETVTPSSGQSIGRKNLPDGSEQDTDNNAEDFELDALTPKAQNIAYVIPAPPTLLSIEVTTLPNKLSYNIGEILDIGGLVVTGIYSDQSLQIEPILPENITGFDSVSPATAQVLTITFEDKTTTYTIDIDDVVIPPPPSDTTPPEILSFYPADNSINIAVDAHPTLTFSEPLNPSTVKKSNIQLREYADLASDAKEVSAVLTLSQNNTVVGFYLSSLLEYNKQYYFFVGSGVKDVAGNSFAKDTWYHAEREEHEFTTVAE